MLGVAQLECSSKEESLRVLVDHTEHKWCPGLHQEGVTSSSRGGDYLISPDEDTPGKLGLGLCSSVP